jgi:hypothetical protein
MARLEKGIIVLVENNLARVQNIARPHHVSTPIVVPWSLRGTRGNLEVGTEVIYSVFEDNTGILLSRSDGEVYGLGE